MNSMIVVFWHAKYDITFIEPSMVEKLVRSRFSPRLVLIMTSIRVLLCNLKLQKLVIPRVVDSIWILIEILSKWIKSSFTDTPD